MRKIITYGTFDLLHYGHINLLKRAKEQGDYLVVALSTDELESLGDVLLDFSEVGDLEIWLREKTIKQ